MTGTVQPPTDTRGKRTLAPLTALLVASLVDTSNLVEEPAVFQWGTSLFKSLPETLNVHHSLESGHHELELKGTTKNVGQHSLEIRSIGQ